MENKKSLSQGEILLILINRSQLSKKEVAERLGINPSYLSEILKSSELSRKIKDRAVDLFGVDPSVFDPGQGLTGVFPGPEENVGVSERERVLKADIKRKEEEILRLTDMLASQQRITESVAAALREALNKG